MRHTWPDEAAFYAELPARKTSAEVDFGCWWLELDGTGPRWRISYLVATGEVIAVCLAGWVSYHGQVELLGVLAAEDRASAQQVLHGWALVCGQPAGLAWVRQQLHVAGRTSA